MSLELHPGRLLDHVHLGSKHFYRAALAALGLELGPGERPNPPGQAV